MMKRTCDPSRRLTAAVAAALAVALLAGGRSIFSQPTPVASGLDYLRSTQGADGSWGGTPTSLSGTFQTTAAALEALKAAEASPSASQASAISFLTAQTVDETLFLAARVAALAGTGGGVPADASALRGRQNADGGWGTAEGFESDVLDTGRALVALKAADASMDTGAPGALNYLVRTQNADGGWPLVGGEESQLFYTAAALEAVGSFRHQFGVLPSQTRAVAYLRGRQNSDGGYGSPASTPFETAACLLAIFTSGQPLTTAETNAINYLNNTQQANGSWADDAYSTALALRALAFPRDTDGDGMSDDCETAGGLNPADPSDAARDTDGDGLLNLEECRRRCLNPNNPDTDGDTLGDGDEAANGSDACDQSSRNRAPSITSQPPTTADEAQGYSYQVQAADPDGDALAYALASAPAGMSASAAGLITWAPAPDQAGAHAVVVKVTDARGASALQQFRVTMLARGVDLTVGGVDAGALVTDPQTLVAVGTVSVRIRNAGASLTSAPFGVLLFEDRNGNGAYEAGADRQLGAGTFSGHLAGGASESLDVRASGVVLFRDNLVHAFVDSAGQIPELDETNNVGHSGRASRHQPQAGDFQPRVKWEYAGSLYGVYSAPVVAPLTDTNGDGLIDERDVPAVVVVDYDFTPSSPARLVALRGDTGAVIFSRATTVSAFDTPAVGDIDGDRRPEIIVPDLNRVHCFNNDGTPRWTSPSINRTGSVALADLDGDGKSEILCGSAAVNFDGTLRWDNFGRPPGYTGGSSTTRARQAADLDLDGAPEIVSGPGATDRDGDFLWSWQTRFNPNDSTWTATGTLDRGATTVSFTSNFDLADAYTAVADLDDDPNPEVIVVNDTRGGSGGAGTVAQSLWIFEHDGRLKTERPVMLYQQVPNQIYVELGAPTVADFDGDGEPEIAIPAKRRPFSTNNPDNPPRAMVAVYRSDGTLMWRRELISSVEPSNGIYPASAFDFDGDGVSELVFQDTQKLYILNGRDGSSLYELGVNNTQSGAPTLYPTVADVDNDGSADIVVPATTSFTPTGPPRKGVLVLSDTKHHWLHARRVWNQWLYHVTNVGEDSGIPPVAANIWQGLNTLRAQTTIEGLDPFAAPDLTVSKVTAEGQDCPASVRITARVGNGGSLHAPAGVRVDFYAGDPSGGAPLLGTARTTRALYPGEFEDVTLMGVTPPAGRVFAKVNDAPVAGPTPSANLSRLPHTWAQASGYDGRSFVPVNNFAYPGIDGQTSSGWSEENKTRTEASHYEVRFHVPVTAASVTLDNNFANTAFLAGTLTFSNGFSTPAVLDPGGEGTTSFPEQHGVTWIRLTASSTKPAGASVSEFVVAGSYVEPPFLLNEGEGRGGNNLSASPSSAAPCDAAANRPPRVSSAPPITATARAAYVYQAQASDPDGDPLAFALDAAPQGMTVSTTGLIGWTPAQAQTGDAAVVLRVTDGRGGEAQQSFTISVAAAPGSNRPPEIASSAPTAAAPGQPFSYAVEATDPDGDAVIFSLVHAPAGAAVGELTGVITWTPAAAQGGARSFTVAALDGRGGAARQTFVVQVAPSNTLQPAPDGDGDGFLVPDDCDDTKADVNPGRAEIPGNGLDDDCNPETPDALPAGALACSLATDRRSYSANAQARLMVRAENRGAAVTAAGLEAQVTVDDAGGRSVFTTVLPIGTLPPRALSEASALFDTGTRPPGTYQAVLNLRYGPAAACTARAPLEITSSAARGDALTGQIRALPARIDTGASTTLSYQVSNTGNVDLPALVLKLLVVEVSTGAAAQTLTEQVSLARGESFSNTRVLGVADPRGGDYLVVLQGETGGISQTIASAPLTITPAATVQFSAASYGVTEGCASLLITVTRTGDTSGAATVDYETSDSTATERKDYTTALGTLRFAAGETSKTFELLVTEDAFAEGAESFRLTLSNAGGAALGTPATADVQIADGPPPTVPNTIDVAGSFACQHYHDFLGRQPDAPGLAFWTQNITQCGADPQCFQVFRVNTSAAFFLSIEFKETGYFVIRAHKAAFGSAKSTPRYKVFLRDQREINEGVVVGRGPWQQELEANKNNYLRDFVSRPEYLAEFPQGQAAAAYVDKLFQNAGAAPTAAERDAAVAAYGAGDATGRAAALRSVVESGSVFNAQYNPAFVLMQYFGYLRRNPDAAPDTDFGGYDFWLNKLNSFSQPGEDMRDDAQAFERAKRAEMVRAFIESIEYRQRFGQP